MTLAIGMITGSNKSYQAGLLSPHLVLSCRCRCHLILMALASLLKSSPLSLPFFSCSLLASLIPTRSLSKTCMLSRWANLHQIHIIRCNSVLQTCQGDLSEFSSAVAPTASLAGEVFAPASGWSKTSPNLIPNCCRSPAQFNVGPWQMLGMETFRNLAKSWLLSVSFLKFFCSPAKLFT